ncbi:hypothetical protein [Micromonospora sp. WMMD980]|uniref:hypothetical protein n=1 Tax=Micromonospora sp. WMMD980 TaxID=3016088 RepID=UPI002417E62B|nr:hypothetical protein [Micromonospora sp. WMMD980]MDG4803570.1 hypothetical protein [Micromonospora sp. WMMD980]
MRASLRRRGLDLDVVLVQPEVVFLGLPAAPCRQCGVRPDDVHEACEEQQFSDKPGFPFLRQDILRLQEVAQATQGLGERGSQCLLI